MDKRLRLLKLLLSIKSNDEDELLSYFLQVAESIVLETRFPYGVPEDYEFEVKYDNNAVMIAQYLYLKQGAEGEISHSENGISRSYESGIVPKSLLNGIVPMVGTI